MNNWLLRGVVLAAAMLAARLVQGALIYNVWPMRATLINVVIVALFAVAPLLWGHLDGRADAAANPDPDRRADLAMTWLIAGLVAGALSGAVAWLISLVYQDIYTGGLISELTTFASFTALLVFLTGMVGVTAGRWLVDRNPPPRDHTARTDAERADTDVFAAVSERDVADAGAALQGEEITAVIDTMEATEPVGRRWWQRQKTATTNDADQTQAAPVDDQS